MDRDQSVLTAGGYLIQLLPGASEDIITMVEGGLDLHPIITHRYHYTEFEKGFEAMISGKSGKVVLDWTKK